jgi:hypothetical protein
MRIAGEIGIIPKIKGQLLLPLILHPVSITYGITPSPGVSGGTLQD